MITIESLMSEVGTARKKQEVINDLENDLVEHEVMDRDDLEQLWQTCHAGAWDPVHDYNSMIMDIWSKNFDFDSYVESLNQAN